MKKNLRYLFTAVLMMFGMTAMAEDVIWSEDWAGWADHVKVDPNGINSNYTFTGTTFKDDGTYKGGTGVYAEALAGGEAPELLIAKGGGTFTATIDLGGKSGDMSLKFKCNKNITITAEGATVGENSGTGNDYLYAITGASGTIKITFENALTANCRLDNIELYQGEAKKAAGLSWGTSSRTVTLGADDNTFPTLKNENGLAVTYSSSETSVATIDAEGVITLVAAGTTIITAESAETAEFEAGHAQYTLTVKEKQGDDPQPETTITVAKALEIIAGLEDGAKTKEEYEVEGYVVNVIEWSPKPDGYGNATFDISDEAGNTTNVLQIFRAKNAEGKEFTTDDTPISVGEKVTVRGLLQKYIDKNNVTIPEMAQNGKVISRSTPTAISSVKAASEQGVIYNLQGQQVMQPTKGLYIINGKKVILK